MTPSKMRNRGRVECDACGVELKGGWSETTSAPSESGQGRSPGGGPRFHGHRNCRSGGGEGAGRGSCPRREEVGRRPGVKRPRGGGTAPVVACCGRRHRPHRAKWPFTSSPSLPTPPTHTTATTFPIQHDAPHSPAPSPSHPGLSTSFVTAIDLVQDSGDDLDTPRSGRALPS